MRKQVLIYARIWKRQREFIKKTILIDGEESIQLSKAQFLKAGNREKFFNFRLVMKNGKVYGYEKTNKVMKDLIYVLVQDDEIVGLMKSRKIVFKLTEQFEFSIYCVQKKIMQSERL